MCGQTTFCVSTHPSVDIWAVSTLGCCDSCCCEHACAWFARVAVFSSLGYTLRSRIAGSRGASMYNFLRNCQTVFHSPSLPILWVSISITFSAPDYSLFLTLFALFFLVFSFQRSFPSNCWIIEAICLYVTLHESLEERYYVNVRVFTLKL